MTIFLGEPWSLGSHLALAHSHNPSQSFKPIDSHLTKTDQNRSQPKPTEMTSTKSTRRTTLKKKKKHINVSPKKATETPSIADRVWEQVERLKKDLIKVRESGEEGMTLVELELLAYLELHVMTEKFSDLDSLLKDVRDEQTKYIGIYRDPNGEDPRYATAKVRACSWFLKTFSIANCSS